jgi:hypothetical protein
LWSLLTASQSDIVWEFDRLPKRVDRCLHNVGRVRLVLSLGRLDCALKSPWIRMLVGMFDSWNILEVHDVVHLVCSMFFQASSRILKVYTVFIHCRERSTCYIIKMHWIFPKYDIFMVYSMYYMSVESNL